MPTTPEQIVEEARKKWPNATCFKLTPPQMLWSEQNGTQFTRLTLTLTYYHRDCDGDELGSYITADSMDDLLAKLTTQDTKD